MDVDNILRTRIPTNAANNVDNNEEEENRDMVMNFSNIDILREE